MKLMLTALTVASASMAYALAVSAAEEHNIVMPNDVKWSAAPPSLPKGAQGAVIFGDPTKDGLFAMRLKFPKGYKVAPHSHPKPEVVTKISGTLKLGTGESGDPSKAQALPAGAIFAFTPGMIHYASTDEEAVIQLNSIGPWGLSYVNPKDDPRTASAH